MDKLNVYLSSPYMEFQETRKQFLSEIQLRSYIYDINAMEMYPAKDIDVLETCINDVQQCNIYVLILGDKYGSLSKKNGEDSGKSFTYWEYETAKEKKKNDKNFARLILLKAGAAAADENPLLTAWKKEIGDSQIQTVWYNSVEEIPKKIIEGLDNFTLERIQSVINKKDILRDKIYLCNREDANLQFSVSIDNDEDAIQFFVLQGHEFNLLQYFITRKELEYADRGQSWDNIDIKPVISSNIAEFEQAEAFIRAAIFNKLKWNKFKSPKDVNAESIVQYMTENNLDYFSVSWFIDSTIWKNDKLKEFIVSFYQKYNLINANLKTGKKILFFAILRYVPNNSNTEEEFYERIKNVAWETNLPRFSKITKQDIKDWLSSNEIEDIEMRTEALISLYLKEINEADMYYKDVEPGLQKMLDLYNKQ